MRHYRTSEPGQFPFLAVVLMAILSTPGCSKGTQGQSEVGIVASFSAMQLIVEPLAGDLPVSSLLPAGVSPHSYSPRPSEVARLHRAALIVYAHPHVDGWISSLGNGPDVAVFDDPDRAVAGEISMQDADEMVSTDMAGVDHNHGNGDPHVWNDPVQVRQALPAVAQALCDLHPDRCPAFRRQATVFSASLVSLEDSLASVASRWQELNPQACFITAQPFIDRFLVRFGFAYVGPLSRSPEVEPSPTSLSALMEQAREDSCSTLIVQDALDNRLERQLAAEQGWHVVAVDPLGHSVSTYEDYLWSLLNALTHSAASPAPPHSAP